MRNLQNRMLVGFALVAVVSLAVTVVASIAITSRQLHRSVRQFLADRLEGVEIEKRTAEQDTLARIAALANLDELVAAYDEQDQQRLLKIIQEVRRIVKIDAVTAVDEDGIVLRRGHAPASYGQDVSNLPMVVRALGGEAAVRTGRGEFGIAIQVAAPVRVGQQIAGAIYAENVIDYRFVRRLRRKFGLDCVMLDGDRLQATSLTSKKAVLDISNHFRGAGETRRPGGIEEVYLAGARYWVGGGTIRSAEGERVGVLLLAESQEPIRRTIAALSAVYVVTAAVLAALALAVTQRLSASIVRPIRLLARMARKIASGDLSVRAPVDSRDELGQLAQAFNEMAMELELSTASVKDLHREIAEREAAEDARAELEGQLRQAQKMEAVGQLAGGVAHDFNNLLQAILGYVDLALAELPANHTVSAGLMEVRQAAERAAALTRQLLTLGRREAMRPERLDLNILIANLMNLLRRVIGEQIELVVYAEPDIGSVYADPGQIEQVLMNLCLNARDAMPEGGRLTIATEPLVVDSQYQAAHPWTREGRFAQISVADTGVGMDEEVLQRVFEPFYTTKGREESTGLGLAMVYGIIRQHEGLITVQSEPGVGTVFRIALPVSTRPVAEAEKTVWPEQVEGGDETILLAEDDELVRNLTVNVLQSAGYTVLVAADGAEAIELLGERASEVQLALLDVVMPKAGGIQVRDALMDIDPTIPVLFISGYSYEAMPSGLAPEGSRLIQKPYHTIDLLRQVRQLLDEARQHEPSA